MKQNNQIDKRSAFKMPENYFDNFSMQMMETIAAQEQPKKRKTLFTSAWTYAIAASFIGILLLGQVFLSSNLKSNKLVETYDSYVLSQVDESAMLDFYFVVENDE